MNERPTFQLFSEMLFYLLKENGVSPTSVVVDLKFDSFVEADVIKRQVEKEFKAVSLHPEQVRLDFEEEFRMHGISYRIDGDVL